MKTKPKLKPGDRFYYYTANGYKVNRIFEKYCGDFLCSKGEVKWHYKAVQGVIRKRKLRGWWINEKLIRKRTPNVNLGWEKFFEMEEGVYISTTKPKNTDGWIFVREVKKKKGK